MVHVIDDDETVRESLEALLTVAGYIVDTFASAEAYLEHLERGISIGHCALLDVHMPGMNGLDLLRILAIRCRSLPVFLLTASHDDRLRDQALDLGAIDCLKPVPGPVLLGALEKVRADPPSARPV